MTIRALAILAAAALALGACRGTPAGGPTAAAAPGAAPVPAARAPIAPADARRARGAGFVYQGEDRLQFSFIVKNTGLPGGISSSGTLGGEKFVLMGSAAEVGIQPGKVVFSGTGTFNPGTPEERPARFTVEGTDGDADALSLRFSVDGAAGDRTIAGQLRQGHVDIEQEPVAP